MWFSWIVVVLRYTICIHVISSILFSSSLSLTFGLSYCCLWLSLSLRFSWIEIRFAVGIIYLYIIFLSSLQPFLAILIASTTQYWATYFLFFFAFTSAFLCDPQETKQGLGLPAQYQPSFYSHSTMLVLHFCHSLSKCDPLIWDAQLDKATAWVLKYLTCSRHMKSLALLDCVCIAYLHFMIYNASIKWSELASSCYFACWLWPKVCCWLLIRVIVAVRPTATKLTTIKMQLPVARCPLPVGSYSCSTCEAARRHTQQSFAYVDMLIFNWCARLPESVGAAARLSCRRVAITEQQQQQQQRQQQQQQHTVAQPQ